MNFWWTCKIMVPKMRLLGSWLCYQGNRHFFIFIQSFKHFLVPPHKMFFPFFLTGFSTFLGMMVTAFAASEIFRIFFKMFFGIVVLGLLHGIIILPAFIEGKKRFTSVLFEQP